MRFNLKFLSTIVFAVTFLVGGFFISSTALADNNAITATVTNVTSVDATLNGINGSAANASGHSFWVSKSTFSTASSTIPDGVYSTVDLGHVAVNTPFSAALSSVTGIPAITPSTIYYFTALSKVDGTWYPGEITSFTTTPAPAAPIIYTQEDFVAFDGVGKTDIPANQANGYTLSTDITATYTGSNTIKLTGYAPIVTPWFGPDWTTHNYVTIGIKLPDGFSGTSVYDAGVMRYDDPTNHPDGYYSMGNGDTPLATTGAALGYLDYSFAADSTNTKKDGLVKLEVIWNANSAPEYFTIDITDLQLDTLTHKFVSTLDQLKTALADTNVTTIDITKDISGIPETLVVGHAVTINGGNHTLTFTGLESIVGNVDDGFMIQAPTTINNLIVNAGLVTPTSWVGTYAIQVFNTTATLNNVTAKNGNGGILGNNSVVTLTGAINVSGNGFGGIESSGASASLDVSGFSWTNTSEAYGLPTVWEDGTSGTTVSNYGAFTKITKGGQYQYYLIAGNAIDPAVTLAVAKVTAHGALTTALGTYTQGNYTVENWTILTGFKTAGDTAIDAATTLDGVTSAQNTATTGMSGVAVIPQHHGNSSGSSPATPAVPAKKITPPADCLAGQLFSEITGRNCNAATPATPANGQVTGGQVLGASTQVGEVLGAEKFMFTLFMKNGSKGNEVIELQNFLNTLGDTLVVDGKFGPKTKTAVIKFQLANGLKGDGVVGPLTRVFLNK